MTFLTLAFAAAVGLQDGQSNAELVPNRLTHRKHPYRCGTSLTDPDYLWCGCSLLNNEWVVIAAHCISTLNAIIVFLGSSLRPYVEKEYTVGKKDFIIHPKFDSVNIRNDIALMKIPFTEYSDNIKSIKLPEMGTTYSFYGGEKALASGWGLGSNRNTTKQIELNWRRFNIISNKKCREYFSILGIPPTMICVDASDGVSPCDGDSGGPLVLESTNCLLGVQSFVSQGGCHNGFPAVFTRITSFLEWIKYNTGIN